MRKRFLPTAFVGVLLIFLVLFGCTKLDTTTLGDDLIPAVDNIHTFADTLPIFATQGYFLNDTTKVLYSSAHALGHIETDPLFGKTDASVYLQFKPDFYPFYFGNANDTILGLDSMVLCLSYLGNYGDSLVNQKLEVSSIFDDRFRDDPSAIYNTSFVPNLLGNVIGSTDLNIRNLSEIRYINNGKDSVKNQIRIKLTDPFFINTLFAADTSGNRPYKNDSLFRRFYNGLAIKPVGNNGNALMYVNLTGENSRLEVYFRKTKNGIKDTTFNTFGFYASASGGIAPSASANAITRDRVGTPSNISNPDYIFLQTNPGTFANLSIPGLTGRPNQIIHRADIIMESVPNTSNLVADSVFSAPNYMYVDLRDTSVAEKWKPIYHDLSATNLYDPDNKSGFPFFPLSGIEPSNFGGTVKYKRDNSGNLVATYKINATRYIQQMVTKQSPNYTIRLWPAFNMIYPQYSAEVLNYFNNVGAGRVRLASGSYAPDAQKRMKLVIIYSKIP